MHTHAEPKLTTKNCTVTCETHPAVVTPKCTIRWKDRSKILPTVHTHTLTHLSRNYHPVCSETAFCRGAGSI